MDATLKGSLGVYRPLRALVSRASHEVSLAWGPLPGGVEGVVVLRRQHTAGPGAAGEALVQRAHRFAKHSHPMLARLLEAGWDGERPYLVTEFVPGATLA